MPTPLIKCVCMRKEIDKSAFTDLVVTIYIYYQFVDVQPKIRSYLSERLWSGNPRNACVDRCEIQGDTTGISLLHSGVVLPHSVLSPLHVNKAATTSNQRVRDHTSSCSFLVSSKYKQSLPPSPVSRRLGQVIRADLVHGFVNKSGFAQRHLNL